MGCDHRWYLLETGDGWVECCAFCGVWKLPETELIIKEADET